jgi:hypothetical protein
MKRSSETLHHITLFTTEQKPLLEGSLRGMVEQSFKNLPRRFPGLRVVRQAAYPNRVEMLLDLHRLDEDLLRIIQSFKSEVKGLAKKEGYALQSLWQWAYQEREINRGEESLLNRELEA